MRKFFVGAGFVWGAFILAFIGGYVANIYKLLAYMEIMSDKMFIARGAGIFFPPFGAIMGYL